MPTSQNMSITKGTLKTEVFAFDTIAYGKFQFRIKNLDGSFALFLQGTDTNNNWQLDVTDIDLTVTIQDSDSSNFDVGTLSYELEGIKSTSESWEKLFNGNVTVSAVGGGSSTAIVWTEGRIGRANKGIDDIDPTVDYDIVIDSVGGYYLKDDGVFTTVGEVEYETAEHFTGQKWIDGKNIYRKIIESGTIPTDSSGTVAHLITAIDNVIDIGGYAKRNAPYAVYTIPTKNIELKVDGANITITNNEPENLYLKIILYYTKS